DRPFLRTRTRPGKSPTVCYRGCALAATGGARGSRAGHPRASPRSAEGRGRRTPREGRRHSRRFLHHGPGRRLMLDAQLFEGGFLEPVFQSQAVFRTVMDAMARPGSIHEMPGETLSPPAPVFASSAAVAL